MVQATRKLFNISTEIRIRDIAVWILAIGIATVGWWHKIEVGSTRSDMQFEKIYDRIHNIENNVLPRIVEVIDANKKIEDNRYERQTKQIAENSKINARMEALVVEVRMLNQKISDLIDGKYNIKK